MFTCDECGLPIDGEPTMRTDGDEQRFLCVECARVCATCEGAGDVDGTKCSICDGTGIRPEPPAEEEEEEELIFGY